MIEHLSNIGAKFHWHVNDCATRHLSWLNLGRARLTVEDAFGAPGDALLAVTVCRILKDKYPHIRINLVTHWPELVLHDPCLDTINGPKSYFVLRFWYPETVARKEREKNVLLETLQKAGITDYDYHARVHLTAAERSKGAQLLGELRPDAIERLAFSTLSKEHVKNWPQDRWVELLERLGSRFELIHLGDDREPQFPGVKRFAGKLSIRESMVILSQCQVYMGPDSFLMHAANGLDVPSVILFGGSRPPACLGYEENTNIYVPMPCGPCWLHDSRGDICPHGVVCMEGIGVDEVETAIQQKSARCRVQSNYPVSIQSCNDMRSHEPDLTSADTPGPS
jgi:ADP-heptose:LPS heptosyltransferase